MNVVAAMWKCVDIYEPLYTAVQEDMYSYVTVADEQQFKSKGTEVVDS